MFPCCPLWILVHLLAALKSLLRPCVLVFFGKFLFDANCFVFTGACLINRCLLNITVGAKFAFCSTMLEVLCVQEVIRLMLY